MGTKRFVKGSSYYQPEDPFLDFKSPQSTTGAVTEDPEGYLRSITLSSKIKESKKTITKAKVEKSSLYYQSEDPFRYIKSTQSKIEFSDMVSEDPEG